MSGGKEAEVVAELKRIAVDGRIACKAALDIARRLGVDSREVGAAADVLGLKISACQLGCF